MNLTPAFRFGSQAAELAIVDMGSLCAAPPALARVQSGQARLIFLEALYLIPFLLLQELVTGKEMPQEEWSGVIDELRKFSAKYRAGQRQLAEMIRLQVRETAEPMQFKGLHVALPIIAEERPAIPPL